MSSCFVLFYEWVRAQSFHCIYPQETRGCWLHGDVPRHNIPQKMWSHAVPGVPLASMKWPSGHWQQHGSLWAFLLAQSLWPAFGTSAKILASMCGGKQRESPWLCSLPRRPWDWEHCAAQLQLRVALEDFANDPQTLHRWGEAESRSRAAEKFLPCLPTEVWAIRITQDVISPLASHAWNLAS